MIGRLDMSQIECRVLNTLAGQWDVVEKFRLGRDLYSELATQFYGRTITKADPAERGMGKQIELSCGFGAGGPTIVRTARLGTYGPPVYLTQEQGMEARDLYRSTHPGVVAYWDTAKRMLWHLLDGSTVQWGPMTVHDHRIFGPGGTWLDFSSLERFEHPLDGMAWRHRVKQGWRKTYGAQLTENVVQWLSRIVLSDAMVRISELGFKIALTTHDDLVLIIDVERGEPEVQLARAVVEMQAPVWWLPNCPIACEAKLSGALDE
jgi:DNA polymerase bacteriophage-type